MSRKLLMNNSNLPITNGLLASVDLANGNTIDISGNGNNAVLSGVYTTDSDGVVFTASNGMINTGLSLSSTEFSMEYKIKYPDNTNNTSQYIFSQGSSTSSVRFFDMFYYKISKLLHAIKTLGNYTELLLDEEKDINMTLTTGIPHKILITYKDKVFKYYIDDVLTASQTLTNPLLLASENLYFGNRSNGDRGFNGTIYYYKIYSTAII